MCTHYNKLIPFKVGILLLFLYIYIYIYIYILLFWKSDESSTKSEEKYLRRHGKT
jgi:hypothetical protein